MINYEPFYKIISDTLLKNWIVDAPKIIKKNLRRERYAHIEEWEESLNQIPEISPDFIDLKKSVRMEGRIDSDIEKKLMLLHPWRKGPYFINNIHLDTEWRSDFKWDRVINHIKPLKNKIVLDIGCGNGYHIWRMIGEHAKLAIGIDPQPLFLCQFYAIKKIFGNIKNAWVLPMRLEDIPITECAFDTCFSMGVIYHRREPRKHIEALYKILKIGGEVIIESLISNHEDIFPDERYAKMRNVWRIPKLNTLIDELTDIGFKNVRVVDINRTKLSEQRKTTWMKFESLEDFLDPKDLNKTIEGYQCPIRAVIIAEK